MHKIKKGLKKKLKGKKGKHGEDELFTAEELEQYKKEHQAQADNVVLPHKQPELQDPDEPECEPREENEEWQRFNALTSGIDTVLKKTQDDLGRIKQDSYFQRKVVAGSTSDSAQQSVTTATAGKVENRKSQKKKSKKWIDFDGEKGLDAEVEETDSEEESDKENKPSEENNDEAAAAVPENDEPFVNIDDLPIYEVDDDEEPAEEDIFDTGYVDIVTSGDIKLAYIPDSPPEEPEDEGPDPFDTTAVTDLIKKSEESEEKKKRVVDLGLAADLLAGRVERSQVKQITAVAPGSTSSTKRRRVPPPKEVDLFGDSSNNSENVSTSTAFNEHNATSDSLLDCDFGESSLLPTDQSDITLAAASVDLSAAQSTVPESEIVSSEVVSVPKEDFLAEFDVILSNPSNSSAPTSKSTAFDLAEALGEDEFSALASESLKKKENPDEFELTTAVAPGAEDDEPDPFESDPFDTSAADFALAATASLEEASVLKTAPKRPHPPVTNTPGRPPPPSRPPHPVTESSEIDDYFDFDPRANSGDLNSAPLQKDLLGGSASDLTDLENCLIAPITGGQTENAELKEIDPFDTSVVDKIVAPGRVELKLLEQELFANQISTAEAEDEFNPRAGETRSVIETSEKEIQNGCVLEIPIKTSSERPNFLDVNESLSTEIDKPLTPLAEASILKEEQKTVVETEIEEADPFDTSHLDTLVPGKAELKQLEQELESEFNATIVADPFGKLKELVASKVSTVPETKNLDFLQSPEDENKLDFKPLTPVTEIKSLNYTDPFDIAFAENIIPGKAELRQLEQELVREFEGSATSIPQTSTAPPTIQRTLSDDEFDPRIAEVPPEQSSSISVNTEELFAAENNHEVKPLTPVFESKKVEHNEVTEEEIDPFDTSIAANILPGKSELKVLENEFLSSVEVTQPKLEVQKSILEKSVFGSKEKETPAITTSSPKKSPSRPPPPKALPADFGKPDLLGADDPEKPELFKPLTPVVGAKVLEAELVYSDPFDTDHVQNIGLGQAELKLIASELEQTSDFGLSPSLKRNFSDDDFNPRASEEVDSKKPKDNTAANGSSESHIFESDKLFDSDKPLTPFVEAKTVEVAQTEPDDYDPFDTTIADVVAQPGRAEIKVLESEFLG